MTTKQKKDPFEKRIYNRFDVDSLMSQAVYTVLALMRDDKELKDKIDSILSDSEHDHEYKHLAVFIYLRELYSTIVDNYIQDFRMERFM